MNLIQDIINTLNPLISYMYPIPSKLPDETGKKYINLNKIFKMSLNKEFGLQSFLQVSWVIIAAGLFSLTGSND